MAPVQHVSHNIDCTTSNDLLIAKNAMSGQASPTAEDMPGSELQENSGARDLTPKHAAYECCRRSARASRVSTCAQHVAGRDHRRARGIYPPLHPSTAPPPLVAMQPEATPQLF